MLARVASMHRLPKGMLNSRLGWRLFGLFLLAIAVPATVLTVFVELQVRRDEANAREAVLGTSARMLGMQTLERLVSAQAALHQRAGPPSVSASPAPGDPAPGVAAPGRFPLSRVEVIDAASLGAWNPVPADGVTGRRDLLLVDRPVPGQPPSVKLAHWDSEGRWWIGHVDADFLWAYADVLPAGVQACARTADRVLVWCSDPDSWAAAQAREPDTLTPYEWELFLPSRFDSAPWTFIVDRRAEASAQMLLEPGSRYVVGLLIALCTAALLAAALLRRLMAPLEALQRSAQRWADGDLSAQADLPGADEFAQIGRTFDEMAAKLKTQFERDEALSRLDRAVLETGDLDAALGRFATDLLAPLGAGGRIGIARRLDGEPGRWSCVIAATGQPARRFESPRVPLDSDDRAQALPAALAQAETALRHVLLGPVPSLSRWIVWKDERIGLLAFDPGAAPAHAIESLDVQEVCAHLAVALGAVRREGQLRSQAQTDSLTGLPNRMGMLERIEHVLGEGGENPRPLSLLFVDLDHFKPINDSHGHLAGDAVLIEVARRLSASVGPRGFVARPAGDEFVVVLEADAGVDQDVQVARRMIAALTKQVQVGGTAFALGASIGIARAPAHGTRADDLLRRADIAMYASKRAGRGRVTVFEEALEDATQRRFWIERELGGAIQGDGLMLLFQPRVEARDHRCVSVEALVRWVHPTRGVISPGEFIPVAEEGPLIEKLGTWVIERACQQLAQWRGGPLGHLKVAVNVSVRQLSSEALPARISEALRRHGLDAGQLEIEVTESVMADNLDVVFAQLEQIRSMGVDVALDDFGTGYSSMSLLRRLPIDVLKIDRAFVSEVGHDASARAVSASIIALGHQLGKRIVAEGVETPEQARWLTDAGADELQGYLFGRPLGAVDLARHLAVPAEVAGAAAPAAVTA